MKATRVKGEGRSVEGEGRWGEWGMEDERTGGRVIF